MKPRNLPWYRDFEVYLLALALLLLFLPSTDALAFPKSNLWLGVHPTAAAACTAILPSHPSVNGFLYHQPRFAGGGPESTQDCIGSAVNGGAATYYAFVYLDQGCPANSTAIGTECQCNSGYSYTGGQCLLGTLCPENKTISGSNGYYKYGSSPPTQTQPTSPALATLVCSGSKRAAFKMNPADIQGSILTYYTVLNNGVRDYYLRGSYEYLCDQNNLHDPCAQGDASPSSTAQALPADTCPAGHTIGLINGKSVCFSTTTGDPINPNTGSTVSTSSSTTANGNGTTTTVTNNADGSTTTTIRASDGSVISTSTTAPIDPHPESEYCKQKPNDPLCQPSRWSGDCTNDFICSGDAVQCAQAREAAQLRCELTKTTAATALGQALLAGSDPNAASLPTPGNATSVNVGGMLQTTGFLASSSCPADQTFTIAGTSIVVPWSSLCGIFQTLGYVLLVIAAIASARIVMGSQSAGA